MGTIRYNPQFFVDTEVVHSLEEYLILGDGFALKRDASASRLRPKTDAEVAEGQRAMEEKLETLDQTSVLLRITDLNGNVQDFKLPYRSMADIAGIQVISR